LEESLDLSYDRLLNEWMHIYIYIYIYIPLILATRLKHIYCRRSVVIFFFIWQCAHFQISSLCNFLHYFCFLDYTKSVPSCKETSTNNCQTFHLLNLFIRDGEASKNTSTEAIIIKINLVLLHLGIMCPCYILSKKIKFPSVSEGTVTNIFITLLYYHERSNNKQLLVVLFQYPPTY
jgi:hypothetical protein